MSAERHKDGSDQKYDAILGRTYGSRHLLSLERTDYYIQGRPESQASNIVFFV